jgi:hypothetical protein
MSTDVHSAWPRSPRAYGYAFLVVLVVACPWVCPPRYVMLHMSLSCAAEPTGRCCLTGVILLFFGPEVQVYSISAFCFFCCWSWVPGFLAPRGNGVLHSGLRLRFFTCILFWPRVLCRFFFVPPAAPPRFLCPAMFKPTETQVKHFKKLCTLFRSALWSLAGEQVVLEVGSKVTDKQRARYAQLAGKMLEVMGPGVWGLFSSPILPDVKAFPKLQFFHVAFSTTVCYFSGSDAVVPVVHADDWYSGDCNGELGGACVGSEVLVKDSGGEGKGPNSGHKGKQEVDGSGQGKGALVEGRSTRSKRARVSRWDEPPCVAARGDDVSDLDRLAATPGILKVGAPPVVKFDDGEVPKKAFLPAPGGG